jgi:hypothetical protein
MPCPICGSGIMYPINIEIEYVGDMIYFSSGGFEHNHDPNFRVGTWRCPNDHEYQLRNKMPCSACTLERQALMKEEQQRSIENPRTRSYNNDHYPSNDFGGFDPSAFI